MDPHGTHLNDYESAVISVGSVLDFYSQSKQYTTVGFGGTPNGRDVSHCFPLGIDGTGIATASSGVLDAYRHSIRTVGLYGPTLFHHCLTTFLTSIKASSQSSIYHIIFILTDGAIHDMQETIDSIVELSKYPVSIVIVGLGSADFSAMEILDGDEVPIKNRYGQ